MLIDCLKTNTDPLPLPLKAPLSDLHVFFHVHSQTMILFHSGNNLDLSYMDTDSVYDPFRTASCDWISQYETLRLKQAHSHPIPAVHTGVLDLVTLAHLNGTHHAIMLLSFFLMCLCDPDGEDHRRPSTGSLGVQPRHDQLCHLTATRHPEWGGEAAVGLTGPQLESPTVCKITMKHIISLE